MPNEKPKSDTLFIGRLGAPRGVHGDIRIHSYSGEWAHFLELREVELEGSFESAQPVKRKPRFMQADRPSSPSPGLQGSFATKGITPQAAPAKPVAAGPRRLKLKVLRIEEEAGGLSMAFEGYSTPEAARALTGMEIVVPRDKASPLKENEWYVVDLVGLALVASGLRLATVRSVLEGGSDPWLEAILPDGRSALVPFRKEFVGDVDIPGGTIELLAPWLLDE